ncbi:hypothetical protein [Enhygromyxa salina]|uniref:Right handed beta helix domain-containing protein n=1 Tax=Enhygromyxa salina TaxID=215803 RepID=A0A2S9YC38_9BACT|nr:hypothetical protein [Enhygromyxa salina]PRQ02622.1 hypothetical protein ENSA7_54510 [Enhygromyxa salina]
MGRLRGAKFVVPALFGLVCGCYLFGDEPKARKKSDGGADDSAQAQTSQDAQPPAEAQPTPEGEATDCPALLTGVETKARTIAAACPPVHVRGLYRIDGGTLEVEAGVQLRFEPGAVLEVGRDKPGTLKVNGTPEQPVRFVADSVSDSGGWQGVRLYAQADGSALSHVEIASAGTADQAALWIVATQVQVQGLTVRSSAGVALELAGERGVQVLGAELSGLGVVARATPAAAAGLHSLTLEPKAQVAITAGVVNATLEWPANPYRIEGLIRVEGEAMRPAQLSLTPGTSLHFLPDARIVIGGFGPGSFSASAGSLDATGVPDGVDQTISLRAAEQQQPGGWGGLHVQDQGQLTLRNVELVHGGARDEGVILAEGSASLSLDGCTFRSDLVGVELRGTGVKVESLANNAFIDVPVAIRTTPALLGALGPDNRYDARANIHLERGKVEADATWAAQAAPIIVHGDVFVDKGATLSIAPGSRLGFDPGVILGVGYYEAGTLELRGTEEAPIILEPTPPPAREPDAPAPEVQPWGGVVLGAHAVKTRFEHVHLRGTGNDAAIELRDTADATLVNVDCAGCAGATVKWGCESTIGNIGVTASDGTPTPMAAPTQCK